MYSQLDCLSSIDQTSQENRPILETKVNCMEDRKVYANKNKPWPGKKLMP